MAMMRALVAFFLCIAMPSFAADVPIASGPTIAIGGMVQHPQSVTRADLQNLPQTSVQVSFVTGHGEEAGNFSGPLLWTVLGHAGLIDAPGKNSRLRHTFMVTGQDGYSVAVSLGEIDPDFGGQSVILAIVKDGKPLDPADGIRLIIPNDRHGSRAVRDVVAIDVR